jgi:hypothetical protein
MKKCIICNKEKELDEFPKKDKITYRNKCKICHNQRRRELKKMSDDEKIIYRKNLDNNRLANQERKKIEKEQKILIKVEHKKRKSLELEEIKKIKKMKVCKICGERNENMFYPQRKSKCKKCCSQSQTTKNRYDLMTDDEKKEYKRKLKIWRTDNLIRFRVTSAKHRAIRKGLSFEITENHILEKLKNQDDKCYISKQPLSYNENDWNSFSLDRLDSNLGYTIENTIIVTKFVNLSKSNLSLDEYLTLIKLVCNNIE